MRYAGGRSRCSQGGEKEKKKTAEKIIQHHLVAAVAKPPIRVIKCNGPFACSHLLCCDTKEI